MQQSPKSANQQNRKRAPSTPVVLSRHEWDRAAEQQSEFPNTIGSGGIGDAASGQIVLEMAKPLTKEERFLRIRDLVLDGRDEACIKELFQLTEHRARSLYASAKASLTVEDYSSRNWPAEVKREYARALAFKIALENGESDDPRRQKLALMALSHLEKDPTLAMTNESAQPIGWERVKALDGAFDARSILDANEADSASEES